MPYSGCPQEAVVNCAKLVIGAERRVSLERPRSSGESVIQLAGVLRLVAAGEQPRLPMKVSGSAPTLLQAEVWREGLAEQADRQLAAVGAQVPIAAGHSHRTNLSPKHGKKRALAAQLDNNSVNQPDG